MLNHYLHFKARNHHSAFTFKYTKGFVSTEQLEDSPPLTALTLTTQLSAAQSALTSFTPHP